ncbi:MAG: MSEP-CTERM sorting domain-containing protein, partial [Kordia sp.]|uniref:MSEP-CTERM sorting domain-containing protein n=1 Tax=Kordia sp. TaxID=1965332 RepID=UPI00385941CE
FLLAATGLPVVFYFFIVFLPYLPLSFVALVFAGAGFLLLTPIVLMILQYKIMSRQFASIAQKYTRKRVLILSFVCVSLVPIAFLGFCIDHKNYLNEIIAETDQFDASDRNYKDHDVEKLRYIFKKMQKDNQRLSVKHVQKRLPLLSVFYDWYVFDNLQISEQKKAEIERLFFGKEFFAWNNYNPPIQTNTTLTYTSNTEYIAKDDFYKTQIDLKITNIGNVAVGEFQSQFTLPKDVFITDYYLDIEGRRTHGILAEKKAANWVYNRVTARRIDPGILQYVYGNVLSLKIFPFGKDQTRTSGFTLYHRTPVHFSINDTPIAIEVHPLAQDIMELGTNSFYIPTKVKKELPKASLPVTYYFLVDNTTKGASFRKQFKEDFEMFSTEIQEEINVLYVDADVNWGTPTTPKESSFNYRKAIKQIQYLHRDQKRIPYVIVYAPYKNRLTGKYLSQEIDKAFPFDNLVECSHWNKKLPKTIELLTFSRNEQSYFIRNNDEPSLLNLDTTDDLAIHFAGNPYLKALQLRLFHDVNDLNPKRKKAYWLHALRESFTQHVLTHSTTFISLETKAQEETLLQFQEDIMNEDYTEKTGSETRRMSEPYFWLLLLVVIFMIGKQKLQDTKEAV